MLIALLAFQIAAAPPRASRPPLPERDSVELIKRVKEVEFLFMMDWRYSWQIGSRLLFAERRAHPLKPPPNYDERFDLAVPGGMGCNYEETFRFDVDPRSWQSHLIKAPGRTYMALCPVWARANWYEPADERKSIDAGLTPLDFPPDGLDTARALRAPVLRLLDSASRLLPGDGWLSGQRVRLHLDQADVGAAQRAAAECAHDFWWCGALQAYVQYSKGEVSHASATFADVRRLMPDTVRCDWDDVGMFFTYTGKRAYEALSCAQRDSVNQRVWWLADPLYIEAGNERRTEHYARQVLFALHAGLEVDERFDMRNQYQGPAVREMVLRFGWPSEIATFGIPMRWHRGNTHALFLGDSGVYMAGPPCLGPPLPSHIGPPPNPPPPIPSCSVPGMYPRPECSDGDGVPLNPQIDCKAGLLPPNIRYAGPQFHTVPLWATVLDPFHASDAGWDLAPPRASGPNWDTGWWPPEFYRRDSGPLVPLASQLAFFRRQKSAIAAAAMSFDTIAYVTRPLRLMLAALILTTGPEAPFAVVRDTVDGFRPRALVAPAASGPALLALEVIPRDGSGPSGRTRFGVDVPQPLGALSPGQLALSDIVLTAADSGQDAPGSMVALMPRMLGSTILRDPKRVGLFWELYGLATGDTIDVALRVIKKNGDSKLAQLGALFGFGRTSDDTLTISWTEPRPNEPTATVDAGVTIRPRGMVLDVAAYDRGVYRFELDVHLRRVASVFATAARDLRIERR